MSVNICNMEHHLP